MPYLFSDNKKSPENFGAFRSGDGRNRTADTRIFSPLLYRLSYVTALTGLQMYKKKTLREIILLIFLIFTFVTDILMNLILDIGNTLAKIAVYENNRKIDVVRVPHNDLQSQVDKIIATYNPKKAIVSNVSNLPIDLSGKGISVLEFSHQTNLPVTINYKTPQTLGLDRIALACGAKFHQQKGNLLIIDAGTCITYDFVSNANEYIGGAISPGLNIRLKAMHHFTGKLPTTEFSEQLDEPAFIGKSTKECLLSGAFWGMVMEINGNISRYTQQFDEVYVFLTGGDANKFEKHVKNRIFANPFLLLDGLNYILEFNS